MPASKLASPTATIEVLEQHGLYTKKSFGQHFLVDDNVVGRILRLAALGPEDVALEVGPGIGTLTLALCDAAGSVVAVERDEALLPVLAETTAECARLAVVQADAVTVSPEQLSKPFGSPTALVANLPYQVAATVVLRFFELLPSLRQATVMVQAEVADRMAASPGSKDYGAYSVKLQTLVRPAGRFNVASSCFLPPPRVESAVIRLERAEETMAPELRAAVVSAADAAFAQRRKTVRNSLRGALGLSADEVATLLERAEIDEGARAETLSLSAFARLGSVLLDR